jgi:CubicO group peptidase (beta-lactamase class C family)
MKNHLFARWAIRPLLSAILFATASAQVAHATRQTDEVTAHLTSNPEEFRMRLRPRYQTVAGAAQFSLEDRMTHYRVPGVAVAIIEDGQIVYAAGFGLRQAGGTEAVDADTVFSAGSVSKIATATLALRLSADEAYDLDQPVTDYLRSWTVPQSQEFGGTDVTMRMILSHTAGFNLHGFRDFQPGEALPSARETLDGLAPARHDPLTQLFEPGSAFKYSGGGYTLAQVLISDLTGESFQDAARSTLFLPLGLDRSRFDNPLPAEHGNIAAAHDRNGEPTALPRGYEAMPEMAASGLWTSANDLGELVMALLMSYRSDDGYLPRSITQEMMTQVTPSQHGLGPRIERESGTLYFHHAGTNNSYHTWIEGHLETGDGLVVLTNGAGGNGLHQEIRNAVADVMNWSVNRPVRIATTTIAPDQLDNYAGEYAVDLTFPSRLRQQLVGGFYDLPLEVRVEAGNLVLEVPGTDRQFALLPVAPSRFIIEGVDLRIGVPELEFHQNGMGQISGMTFHTANAQSHYIRQ